LRIESRIATPRGELARLQEAEAQEFVQIHERIMEAVLSVSGELGYRNVAVRHLLERYGGYRLQFYRHFESKADCYAAAYEVEIERLYAGLMDAAGPAESWRGGLRAALDYLAGFIEERPALARGLLIEVYVAGGPALAKREEVFERLSSALDRARHETKSRHSPPPVTAAFMVGAIEQSVALALTKGEPESFVLAVPELTRMISVAYFGDDA
jgi:AcrR family transcriptional regulator